MKRFLYLAIGATVLAAFVPTGARAQAQESKIATIHLQRVVDEYHKGKSAGNELKKAVESYQGALKKMQEVFDAKKKVLDQLVDEINSGVLSNKKKAEKIELAKKMEKELIKLERERRQLVSENEEALSKQDIEAYKAVVGDILKHLEAKLQKDKYDFVIKMTDTSEDRPFIREGAVVAVGTNAVDITDEVIKEMNAKK